MTADDGLKLSHITLADPTLPHQVIFRNNSKTRQIEISCNCRTRPNPVWKKRFLNPMGPANNLDEARATYNDPANHKISFGEEDMAKW